MLDEITATTLLHHWLVGELAHLNNLDVTKTSLTESELTDLKIERMAQLVTASEALLSVAAAKELVRQ